MTPQVEVVSPDASLHDVALKMRDIDAGAIPVCDGDRILGVVTDRDIVVRVLAASADPNGLTAADVMTSPAVTCFEDDEIEDAARLMEERQIRRLLVLGRDHRLAGIVSLGDLACKTGDDERSGEVLEHVSEPGRAAGFSSMRG